MTTTVRHCLQNLVDTIVPRGTEGADCDDMRRRAIGIDAIMWILDPVGSDDAMIVAAVVEATHRLDATNAMLRLCSPDHPACMALSALHGMVANLGTSHRRRADGVHPNTAAAITADLDLPAGNDYLPQIGAILAGALK